MTRISWTVDTANGLHLTAHVGDRELRMPISEDNALSVADDLLAHLRRRIPAPDEVPTLPQNVFNLERSRRKEPAR